MNQNLSVYRNRSNNTLSLEPKITIKIPPRFLKGGFWLELLERRPKSTDTIDLLWARKVKRRRPNLEFP